MCGIVGYTGKNKALKPVLRGLTSLEYRGYDSAGITLLDGSKAATFKEIGRVQNVCDLTATSSLAKKAHTAIGHTRWATHGEPTVPNAHPHTNQDKTIFVVHNGIIENHNEIREMLVSNGYKFVSKTDTETIPHLLDYNLKKLKNFKKAFLATMQDLKGAYAIAATYLEEPDSIYISRLGSPLVVGVGKGEHFISSDPSAIADNTKKIIFLSDYDVVKVTPKSISTHNIKSAKPVKRATTELDYDIEQTDLGEFKNYMLKEIYDTPDTVRAAIRGRIRPESRIVRLGGLESIQEQLRYIDRIVIVACGTSYYAGLVGEYLIEEIAGIPVEVHLASEFKYRNEPFSRSTALLAISQSGETADTIAAIKKVEGYGVLKLGIVNAVGSTIARITDAGVYCHAGPEQSVASTKAFVAQVSILTEIALHLSDGRSQLYKPIMDELVKIPDKIEEILKDTKNIEKLAKKYSGYKDMLFIGRGYSYPCALEGALKLKEISYIHAEGYAAGEMKHGPLAMIDKDFATFALATNSPVLDKTLSNIEEIKARKGPILAIATKGSKKLKGLTSDVMYIPKTLEQTQPLLIVIVMQLFSYYVAVEKGLDVDRPRNLAKSVTVE